MRAVVWTVVGLIAVVAIVVIVSTRVQESRGRQAAMPTETRVKQDIVRFNKKADKYAAEARKLRETLGARLTDEKKAELAKVDTIIAQVRTDAAKLATLKGDELLKAKRTLQDLQQKYDDLKHHLERK
jgi:uncharacterized protein YlxW (UPF0749 family)